METGRWMRAKTVDYVQQLAYKYDTFGLTHEFTTHAGKKITLKAAIMDGSSRKKETTAALVEYIKKEKPER